jgi:hypothetical protein
VNAQDNRDAMPFVQGDERCDDDQTGGRTLHQDEGVLQRAHLQDQGSRGARTKTKEINWNEWNPFERATGEALRQLNKRQRKQSPLDCVDEALL